MGNRQSDDRNDPETFGSNKNEEDNDTVMHDDISDDETVVTSTSSKKHAREEDNTDGEWKTIMAKRKQGKEKGKKNETTQLMNNQNEKRNENKMKGGKSNIENKKLLGDSTTDMGNEIHLLAEEIQKNQYAQKMPTFLEKLKGKKREDNDYSVRVNFSFTPKTGTNGELKRVATELLEIANRIDKKAMLVVWEENMEGVDLGPITINDLMNPYSFVQEIKNYVHKPKYIVLQPGNTAYKLGVKFSVSVKKYQFLRGWNAMKQSLKGENRTFYPITLAPMQNSPTTYLIGIAAGSSEDQDIELLNKKLGEVTGIQGIEMSFQNINQQGITNESNEKAAATGSHKSSKEYL